MDGDVWILGPEAAADKERGSIQLSKKSCPGSTKDLW
jgi:hypothetical protein